LRKLFAQQEVDGLILAKAALDRLLEAKHTEFTDLKVQLSSELKSCLMMLLPLEACPTAAAQGALAIEIRKDRRDLRDRLSKINCEKSFAAVVREREILKNYGGGCHQKIGVSVIERPYGRIEILQGETPAGESLSYRKLLRELNNFPSVKSFYPQDLGEAALFDRKPIDVSNELTSRNYLWVARANALPESLDPQDERVLWTAGLRTWRQLSGRGHWVTGSAESLGESEDPALDRLLGMSPGWLKLTHADSPAQDRFENLATYRLMEKPEIKDFPLVSHYYWMSFSSFSKALQLRPEILRACHSSGPGRTAELIRQKLGESGSFFEFLSYEDWLNKVRSELKL
jgi:hydroxymethylbilane synthase